MSSRAKLGTPLDTREVEGAWLYHYMTGHIHSTESFGSVDGPGIRFIIFFQGCGMRCRYCQNPDTWEVGQGQEMTAEELLAKAERYRSYWGKDGGITVSGGEPLLQIDFLTELFQKAKERGIHTCIDTCGQPFTRREPFFSKFQKLMDYTDLLLLDIKHINSLEHQKLTHHPNENILDCARYLSEIGKPIWVRHVLVPGITDNDDYLTELRHFLRPLQNIQRIDVLPYHSLGLFKWKQRNIPYTLEGVPSPTAERVANARRILTEG